MFLVSGWAIVFLVDGWAIAFFGGGLGDRVLGEGDDWAICKNKLNPSPFLSLSHKQDREYRN